MSKYIQAFKSYEGGNKTGHDDDGDALVDIIDAADIKTNGNVSIPKITNGTTTSWNTNNSPAGMIENTGKGIFSKQGGGSMRCVFSGSGTPTYTNIRIGGSTGVYLRTGETDDYQVHNGCGFYWRRRTTDTSGEGNRDQHSNYVKRWGIELIHRETSEQRFWSSGVMKTNGIYDPPSSNDNTHFVQVPKFQDFLTGNFTVKALYFQMSNRDEKGAGYSSSFTEIYGFRFYYKLAPGHVLVRPKVKTLANRNKASWGPL